MLSSDDHWLWDFWIAEDEGRFHIFFLQAPRDPSDPDRRHRSATIGHASSTDLSNWLPHGPVLGPGALGEFDETATWTGSVVRGPDLTWRMYYTGSRFLNGYPDLANIEAIGMATSQDLSTWRKTPGLVLEADPQWYELLGSSSWPEQAWRDPWVYRDDTTGVWHMLVTARANHGPDDERGVIGHATSNDLNVWQVGPPLSLPGAGFGHLEVLQLHKIRDQWILLFSCSTESLSESARSRGLRGGIWSLPVENIVGPFDVARARRVSDESLYSGRLVTTHDQESVLLAFEGTSPEGFRGAISDPIEVSVTKTGHLTMQHHLSHLSSIGNTQ